MKKLYCFFAGFYLHWLLWLVFPLIRLPFCPGFPCLPVLVGLVIDFLACGAEAVLVEADSGQAAINTSNESRPVGPLTSFIVVRLAPLAEAVLVHAESAAKFTAPCLAVVTLLISTGNIAYNAALLTRRFNTIIAAGTWSIDALRQGTRARVANGHFVLYSFCS